jgi:hypothetical protein
LLGYVGFFEAYFDGDIEIVGDRAVGGLMHMAFSNGYRYRANPLLLVKRRYLEWRNSNNDFARAKANALTTPLIFRPRGSCADSGRFPMRSGGFLDDASCGWKRRNCAIADG